MQFSIRLNSSETFLQSPKFVVPSGECVPIVNGFLEISDIGPEIDIQKQVWRQMAKARKLPMEYRGFIRYDGFLVLDGKGGFKIRIIEINGRGIECLHAIEAVHQALGREVEIESTAQIALPYFQKWAGDKEIIALVADNESLVKRIWGPIFVRGLQNLGLRIRLMEVGEFRDKADTCFKGTCMYLVGDVGDGPSQFPGDVARRLWNLQEEGGVSMLNRIMRGGMGDKYALERIIGLGPLLLNEPDKFTVARDKQSDLVLKPINGASGDGITIGRLVSPDDWREALTRESQTHFLSELVVPETIELHGVKYAVDCNITYWAEGGKLTPLYVIARIKPWEKFRKTWIMNVAKGGGIVPPKRL